METQQIERSTNQADEKVARTGINGEHKRFVTKKKRAWMTLNAKFAAAFLKAGYAKVAQSLYDCETTKVLVCCAQCGAHWHVLNHCRQRVCVLCSFRVAQERKKYLTFMTRNMQHPKLITLTQQAWKYNPKKGIDFLRKSFNKLRRTKVFDGVKGGAYMIEVIPRDGYWHIHMHILLDAPYIPYQKLFSAWRSVIHQRVPQVDIRSASDRKAREYLAKDASKNIVYYVEPEKVVEWYEATHNKRLFATFGSWYRVKIAEAMEFDAWEKIKPVCPVCGSANTCFYARDGPYVLGHELWDEVWKPILASVPMRIPVELVNSD